jgi:hypothetical protein
MEPLDPLVRPDLRVPRVSRVFRVRRVSADFAERDSRSAASGIRT